MLNVQLYGLLLAPPSAHGGGGEVVVVDGVVPAVPQSSGILVLSLCLLVSLGLCQI